ncbi:MAG TPA: AMP-binding protein [Myxococcota bacterium]|nr:AMP-binding protein [Myxococcota bacterium]
MYLKLQERHPCISPAGEALYRELRQHPDAPPWNYEVGDRLLPEDHPVLQTFRALPGHIPRTPSDLAVGVFEKIPFYQEFQLLPWEERPLCSRDDLRLRLPELVPDDADFRRLIKYGTSGTEGSMLEIPSHPRCVALNHVLVERALALFGVALECGPVPVAAHICAQFHTYTFLSLLSVWGDGAFVKVNLQEQLWPRTSARRYLVALNPQLLTGDPVAFAELLEWEIPLRPRAILSAAAKLSPALSAALQARYHCPVIDWYSLTESGPVACTDPEQPETLRLFCPDLLVEITDAQGRPVPEGQRGELVLSGGRNPYLPLIRYRTGDTAARVGDHLVDFEGRRPLSWRSATGYPVTPVDLARVLNRHVWACFQFREENGAFSLRLRPVEGWGIDREGLIGGLEQILGRSVRLELVPELGRDGKKVIPWR